MIDPMVYVVVGLNFAGWGVRIVRGESEAKAAKEARIIADAAQSKWCDGVTEQLEAIKLQTTKTNGIVGRHHEILEMHGREIERSRDERTTLGETMNRMLLTLEARDRGKNG